MILIYPESLIFVISNKKTKYQAFTLIELLVVVAIIGILAAVGVVAYNGYTGAAKEKVTESNFNNINKALVLEFKKCELDSSELIFTELVYPL